MKEYAIDTRCGLICATCTFREKFNCGGCISTNGHPFHGECAVAICCQDKDFLFCGCARISPASCCTIIPLTLHMEIAAPGSSSAGGGQSRMIKMSFPLRQAQGERLDTTEGRCGNLTVLSF
jgi:hypothetical protein